VTPSLASHLSLYGIRHFETDEYWDWASGKLGEKKARELDGLRDKVTKRCAKKHPRDVKIFYDAVADPEIAPIILSMKAGAMRASGEAVAERLAGRKNILDLGCGIGALSTWYARHAQSRVTGVDFSEASIALAERMAEKLKFKNARFLVWDLCITPHRANRAVQQERAPDRRLIRQPPLLGQFDAVVDTQTLSIVQNIPRALVNIKLCLAPGGVLISVPVLETARHARAYIRCLEGAGFRLHAFDFIQYADCGNRGAYPVLTASLQGKSIRVQLGKEYEKIWQYLNPGDL